MNLGLNGLERSFCGSAVDSQEMVHQKGKVTIAIAQGRDENRDDVDAVVEVLAELPFADQFLQILVAGTDQAEVDFLGGAATEPLHGTLLKNAQKLALQIWIQCGDFVQEESAVLRGFDQSSA